MNNLMNIVLVYITFGSSQVNDSNNKAKHAQQSLFNSNTHIWQKTNKY